MRQEILRKGAKVQRWHTITNVKEQTVADHSWGVASIILDVWPDSSNSLITYALWHDIPEFVVGDVPVTAKWANENLARAVEKAETQVAKEHNLYVKLTTTEKIKLAIADLLEVLWYASEEIALGNSNFLKVFHTARKRLETLIHSMDCKAYVTDIINHLQGEINHAKS